MQRMNVNPDIYKCPKVYNLTFEPIKNLEQIKQVLLSRISDEGTSGLIYNE